MEEVRRFERMLTAEGALILKFWFHLSKDAQYERLRRLEEAGPDALAGDRDRLEATSRSTIASARSPERALRETSTAEAPWIVVEGVDERYRSLTVGNAILAALRRRLDEPAQKPPESHTAPFVAPVDHAYDLNSSASTSPQKLDKETYERDLEKLERKLTLSTRAAAYRDISVMAVFEGSDAAGKGGAIRRITAIDKRCTLRRPDRCASTPRRSAPSPTSGASGGVRGGGGSGATSPAAAPQRSSTAPGMAACWWSAWRASPPSPTRCARHRDQRLRGAARQELHRGSLKFWPQVSQKEQLTPLPAGARAERGGSDFKIVDGRTGATARKWDAYERAVCDMEPDSNEHRDRPGRLSRPRTSASRAHPRHGVLSDAIEKAIRVGLVHPCGRAPRCRGRCACERCPRGGGCSRCRRSLHAQRQRPRSTWHPAKSVVVPAGAEWPTRRRRDRASASART